ncbi:phage integrase N-terminal SAM-like domain-containing protein [Laribacter hongkongensis]|uniref:phage integrase N-terminal SAM-like domain-containing protein n=1 Tax=Laribacter hongkongensis TaxID=168471 RepID=UPI002816FE1C|nr:phage integrase N-terminal SAM-like domain-containing protein [Laribacter hongkongensis]
MPESTQPDGTAAPRLLDVLRETLRVRHYNLRTEQQYVNWVRRFFRFHHHRHPREMGVAEVSSFLTHLPLKVKCLHPRKIRHCLRFCSSIVMCQG